ncbi:asparagine synthetase B family protein [Sphingobacterium paucimobilis]|uniref:asparagine synthase (glutamine-hydrolyzing) n=1 Tax=Sphingobacterium paucimobilis HER1398 TaxID=1346330 RepID=U2HR82_9SPHI|nr:hypothetical protein [Sphingobacterium paucimobilis]ERJ57795.1 hypothetical protein M472_03355 [Sphingobacterium paucimobilis HER1398]ERJ60246.1 hypothetical protein M472_15925 [Sphingobacterium paucimobilis HER1398]
MEIARGNWVGFDTVFYNESTGKHSLSINEVIDFSNLEIDPEGLAAYLDFGYCVFGRTPVKHVHYLLPHQVLKKIDGKLAVEEGTDTTLAYLDKETHEEDVLELLRQRVQHWESSFTEDILIPTSGGFDSRLLNLLIADKSRIHAYTYGTSNNQGRSREVVYAKELATRLGIHWQRVDLGSFNGYQNDWFDLFGCSVGAVGTYHMEFFDKIQSLEKGRPLHMLSGIIGDAWAGAVAVRPITSPADYRILGHTHQMTADSQRATGVDYRNLIESVHDKQKDLLREPKYRIITAMRTKMMLLKSLISIPQHFGYPGYSPFIEEDIALAMLNLPEDRKASRIWQRDYFRKNNVLFEEEKHAYTYQNSLNYYALTQHKLELLDINVLKEVIHINYLQWINAKLQRIGSFQRIYQTLMHTPKVKGVMKMMGFKNELIQAYFAYTTLKPIEKLLKQRNYGT